MLLKIELENFFSIKNRVCLDFVAAKSNTKQARELSYNVIDCLSLKKVVLPQFS